MEKTIILYKPQVEFYINNLVFILFENNYFNYLENAICYKDKIIDYIEENITTFPHKTTPLELKEFGSNYIFYKSNSRTTWYIFFESKGKNYIITYITNSNSEQAKWL